jgi:transcription antitermination factor NusG
MALKEENWVILELTEKGEDEARHGNLLSIVCRNNRFKPTDVFIPIIKTGECSTNLLEGYIFIKNCYPFNNYYSLTRTQYVLRIVSEYDERSGLTGSGVILDSDLKAMVKKASDKGGKFKIGNIVKIKDGDFNGMECEIIDILNTNDDDWFPYEKPDIIELRKAMVRKWIENGCRTTKSKKGTQLNEEVQYYIVMIKMRSIEILTLLDNFCLE